MGNLNYWNFEILLKLSTTDTGFLVFFLQTFGFSKVSNRITWSVKRSSQLRNKDIKVSRVWGMTKLVRIGEGQRCERDEFSPAAVKFSIRALFLCPLQPRTGEVTYQWVCLLLCICGAPWQGLGVSLKALPSHVVYHSNLCAPAAEGSHFYCKWSCSLVISFFPTCFLAASS